MRGRPRQQVREQGDLPQAGAQVDHHVTGLDGDLEQHAHDRGDAARVVADPVVARRGRRRFRSADAQVLLDRGVARPGRHRGQPGEQLDPPHAYGRPCGVFAAA